MRSALLVLVAGCAGGETVPRLVVCPATVSFERLTLSGDDLAACYGYTPADGWPDDTPTEIAEGCTGAGECVVTTPADRRWTFAFDGCVEGREGEMVSSEHCSPAAHWAFEWSSDGRWLQAQLQEDCGMAVPVEQLFAPLPPLVPLGGACEW